jgi:hypothetical protein
MIVFIFGHNTPSNKTFKNTKLNVTLTYQWLWPFKGQIIEICLNLALIAMLKLCYLWIACHNYLKEIILKRSDWIWNWLINDLDSEGQIIEICMNFAKLAVTLLYINWMSSYTWENYIKEIILKKIKLNLTLTHKWPLPWRSNYWNLLKWLYELIMSSYLKTTTLRTIFVKKINIFSYNWVINGLFPYLLHHLWFVVCTNRIMLKN